MTKKVPIFIAEDVGDCTLSQKNPFHKRSLSGRTGGACLLANPSQSHAPSLAARTLETNTNSSGGSDADALKNHLLIIHDGLRCSFAQFNLGAHFLVLRSLLFHSCGERFNFLLLLQRVGF